ncbi:MAG: tellurite resistance TerB family protein [Synechococcus sp.]|nr:tellurite resistance TerB family protein [Synechococcus sp.]
MNSAEAFAAIALAAVACDGILGRDEAHALRRQLEYRSIYRDRSEAAMGDLFDNLLHLLREQGVMGLIEQALPVLSTKQCQSALAVASHLVHADRTVTAEESDFLEILASRIALPEGEARSIIASIEALNRDTLDD